MGGGTGGVGGMTMVAVRAGASKVQSTPGAERLTSHPAAAGPVAKIAPPRLPIEAMVKVMSSLRIRTRYPPVGLGPPRIAATRKYKPPAAPELQRSALIHCPRRVRHARRWGRIEARDAHQWLWTILRTWLPLARPSADAGRGANLEVRRVLTP